MRAWRERRSDAEIVGADIAAVKQRFVKTLLRKTNRCEKVSLALSHTDNPAVTRRRGTFTYATSRSNMHPLVVTSIGKSPRPRAIIATL